jgi:dCMP deaminase
VSGLPVCSECAKGIIQVGISTVITQYDKEKVNPNWAQSNLLTKQMFNEANVNYFQFDMNGELIV